VSEPEAQTPEQPKKLPKAKRPSVPGTIQVGTLASRAKIDLKKLRHILHAASVKDIEGRDRFYRFDLILVVEADRALASQPDPTATMAAIKDKAAAAVIPGEKDSTGTGNIDEDPIPAALLAGEVALGGQGFPMPSHPEPGWVYWWINSYPDRQREMRRRGWRFTTGRDRIKAIQPDGLYLGMVNAKGRIAWKEYELAQMPIELFNRIKAERNKDGGDDRLQAEIDSYYANIEAAKQKLRDRYGKGAERHIAAQVMDQGEAEERAQFAAQKSAGLDPTVSRAFVGKNAQ